MRSEGVRHANFLQVTACECHGRCLNAIRRCCASLKVSEDLSYILRICPEVGLSAQNSRCAECNILITNTHPKGVSCFADVFKQENAWTEPRCCDYTGLYYCPACHWNTMRVIPAHVLHNWDFDRYVVCCQSKQFLHVMSNNPVLDVERLNPHLLKFVDELATVKKFCEDLLLMKSYLMVCRSAQDLHLLCLLEERQHFVENTHMYSLQDLVDTNSGILVEFVRKVHGIFEQHIRTNCLVCHGKGFICEICNDNGVIFPFDGASVFCCSQCSIVLHSSCFASQINADCPKCFSHLEIAKRKEES